MAADAFLRKSHRVIAIAFLLTIPPAWWASARGGEPAILVYLPLFPLLWLSISGTYMLVRPWIRRRGAA